MNSHPSYHLHFTGLVQGVGFRPFVYKLATKRSLKGWVINSTDGVHIHLNADKEIATECYQFILQHPPPLAIIRSSSMQETPYEKLNSFEIRDSLNEKAPNLIMTPDYTLCDECRRELNDPHNRRFRYPFITCTHCGPRYSIITHLPYDRPHTTMTSFQQCAVCSSEYMNPLERRHFSQTNSCMHCGMQLEVYENGMPLNLNQETILSHTIQSLREGKIAAIKGIGGFLFVCDARNKAAVQLLRSRKHRPAKPFAVLYPTLEDLKNDFQVNAAEKELLCSPLAPILLLKPQSHTRFPLAHQELAPGLDKLGVMLPYVPLLELIARDFGAPLVATSANISGSPIIFTNTMAKEHLPEVADLIVLHNRDITVPQDDSVWNSSPMTRTLFPIRRSRGMAPSFLSYQSRSGKTILALGALMKSSFSLSLGENTYISQYLGNTEGYESQQSFRHTLEHFLQLFKALPDLIVTDAHPEYFSHQLGLELHQRWQVPVKIIQHHKAHAAAVLAENNLLATPEPILCIIWDGTGLGDQKQIWGGEAFIYRSYSFERIAHLPFFPILAGDKMAREPRLSALPLLYSLGLDIEMLRPHFTLSEWKVYAKMLNNPGTIVQTDSAGRLFDAIASLLNILQKQSYEGEAAMLLEQTASRFLESRNWTTENRASSPANLWSREGLKAILEEMLQSLATGKSPEWAAAFFHTKLAASIRHLAEEKQIKKLAFSGGVFQNGLLCDLIRQAFQGHAQTYFHLQLPANDENISFGQLVIADIEWPTNRSN